MDKKIAQLFNKFAGREIPITNDIPSVIREMEKTARDNGLELRVWYPGSDGTADYRTDRVNAHIEKGTDGKWRVSNKFDIG